MNGFTDNKNQFRKISSKNNKISKLQLEINENPGESLDSRQKRCVKKLEIQEIKNPKLKTERNKFAVCNSKVK